METYRKKTLKKTQSISDLWDNFKWCCIHITIDTEMEECNRKKSEKIMD